MHITFGWGFDTARWADSAATSGSLGSVTVGPAQLTGILATRLALSAPECDAPLRIAAYRAVLTRVLEAADPHSWPVGSFRADPWTVARELLSWRDSLVGAGWDASAPTADAPHRLQLLSTVEQGLDDEPGWSPGPADVLREVDRTLSRLVSTDDSWPLGISRLDLDGDPSDLPPVWHRVIGNLRALGVEIGTLPAPPPLEGLTLITSDTAWDAAPVAAAHLAGLSEASVRHTVVAGASTALLDSERLRIGHPPLGVADRQTSSYAQVIPLYLRAMTVPHDIHALVGLLNTGITVDGTTSPLIPGALRRRLVDALNQQPGVGGPAWDSAVSDALADTADRPDTAQRIRDFDTLIRHRPLVDDDGFDTKEVSFHLEWLQRRFTSQGRGRSVSSDVGSRIAPVRDLLAGLGGRISSRELDQVIAEFTGDGGISVRSSADACADVVTDPAHLGTGSAPVVWWLPVDDTAAPRDRARPVEVAWLSDRGVVLPDPEAEARLVLESQLRALRRRRQVTALTAATVDGETGSQHPALTFLIDDLHRQGREPLTVEGGLPEEYRTVPGPVSVDVPDPVSRSVTPGDHLLPTRLSFSQWEKLLVHPLEWLLERRLGIRAGGLATIPTGNQMVGTWLHTVVENIVNRHLDSAAGTDGSAGTAVTVPADHGEIAAELRRLLPWYAAELLTPGRSRELGTTLALAEQSIAGLFTTLAEAGIRIRAVEASFSTTLTGSHGAEGELELGGLRDMDVLMPDGTPGVIDLKYTFARKKYRDAVRDGTALQLAVYAASVADEHGIQRLAEVPVAYFNLRDNRLDTTDERFGAPETLTLDPSDTGAPDADGLWDRAVAGLNRILDDLRAGRVTDLGNLVIQDAWQAWENPKRGAFPTAPYDEETTAGYTAALRDARTTGFFPEKNAVYTDYPLITGAQGDFS
ncbi:PD-(D/E)XK nuclease family protein [Corynebacterium sp.]|jgi:ATP-dependent helicase/nuclease subunit B|uniref:PD-(D/E)XK nuclease family protein n=1 Tax=Corynebacterium sp. TaxID=1720 RepID=UPI0025C5C2EB|nr:PD-(D/E)XK nuclease family protein [Corynebacterium sp.]